MNGLKLFPHCWALAGSLWKGWESWSAIRILLRMGWGKTARPNSQRQKKKNKGKTQSEAPRLRAYKYERVCCRVFIFSSLFNHLQAQIKNVKFCQLADILDDMRGSCFFFHLPSSALSSSAYCHQLPAPVCFTVHLHYSIFQTASVKNRCLFVAD